MVKVNEDWLGKKVTVTFRGQFQWCSWWDQTCFTGSCEGGRHTHLRHLSVMGRCEGTQQEDRMESGEETKIGPAHCSLNCSVWSTFWRHRPLPRQQSRVSLATVLYQQVLCSCNNFLITLASSFAQKWYLTQNNRTQGYEIALQA